MTQYILTDRCKKRCTMIGEKVVERPGNIPNGIAHVDILFVPGVPREIPEGLDVSKALKARLIREYKVLVREPEVSDVVEDTAGTAAEETKAVEPAEDAEAAVEPVASSEVDAESEVSVDDLENIRTVSADVGVMSVEISAGEDDTFGTEDDVTTIKPKSEVEDSEDEGLALLADGEEPVLGVHYENSGVRDFKCLYCGKILRREASMVNHIEKKHSA